MDGRVKPDVLMSLGRVDQVDIDGLRRLAASINKHFGDDGDEAGVEGGPGYRDGCAGGRRLPLDRSGVAAR
ncbi:hypothetical protein GCM10022225_79930 [Plantactinospora mayteni]|uniref:STAS domain-containing protein n=1 Tax=Plantactinospora mayteni TaxID=566021 RepID=A0ABQ4F357_9ACTN|nr:hypothetical protein [Plantactinospora mayteni]GIH01342.1 hypothetical protein Pma05_79140 [Plantactinospora mayteni]